jgi:hypothetical protein
VRGLPKAARQPDRHDQVTDAQRLRPSPFRIADQGVAEQGGRAEDHADVRPAQGDDEFVDGLQRFRIGLLDNGQHPHGGRRPVEHLDTVDHGPATAGPSRRILVDEYPGEVLDEEPSQPLIDQWHECDDIVVEVQPGRAADGPDQLDQDVR